MRLLASAAAIAVCILAGVVTNATDMRPSGAPGLTGATAFDLASAPSILKQPVRTKPQRVGDDSCRWANDNECDDPDIGTGACRLGTDYSDCRRLREGREDDSCRWARDGECDEPNFGTGACVQGSDRTDCGDIAWMRNQTDSCATAFNNVCEEPGRGSGSCAARSDRADCHGRARPMGLTDHFFGHDDRVLVAVDETPWRYIGVLRMNTGEACTATLVGPNVIVTAAHCIHTDRGVDASARWSSASGQLSARVTAYLIDPRFNYRRFNSGTDIDGMDWALLRLDQPLGERLGYAGVQNLTARGRDHAVSVDLMQAGYSWDTGGRLSGNLRCRMTTVHADNTFSHECDTTRGDSGSAFMVRNGDGYDVVGVDSNFRSNSGGPFLYIAVSAAAFADRVADFAAGRTGRPVGGGAAKPPRS
jgi:protease YdgD